MNAYYRGTAEAARRTVGLIWRAFDETWKLATWTVTAGQQLDQALWPGDHVIFARLDRAFRSLEDFVVTMKRWAGW